MRVRMKQKYLFVSLLVLSIIFISALVILGNAESSATLDKNILAEKALLEAQMNGLMGMPINQETARMNLSGWNKLINAEIGMDADKFDLTPDTLVFILAIKGNVEWRGVSLPQPGQETAENYDNITVDLNDRTGDLIWVGAYYPDYPMPIPIL
jgi:hypothetical protein